MLKNPSLSTHNVAIPGGSDKVTFDKWILRTSHFLVVCNVFMFLLIYVPTYCMIFVILEEKIGHVPQVCISAFASMGVPEAIKTDSNSSYTSKVLPSFFSTLAY